jgi:hypothetical protein
VGREDGEAPGKEAQSVGTINSRSKHVGCSGKSISYVLLEMCRFLKNGI